MPERIHASTVAIGEHAVLIRGASGSGKSTLALALIEAGRRGGRFARLVADDRTEIEVRSSRLVARPVAPLEGLVERRGLGLTPERHLDAAVVALVVDLVSEESPRMPEPEDLVVALGGIDLPRLKLVSRAGQERLVLAALDLFLGRD